MKFDIWSAIFGASGLGLLKLLFDVIKYYTDRHDKQNKTEQEFTNQQTALEQMFYELLSGAVKIQEIIEELMIDINAARIMIVKIENGGGIPQLGTIQTMTVLNECLNRNYTPPHGKVTSIKQDFQAYTVDQTYQRLLTRTMETGTYMYSVEDLNHSVFSTLYRAQGIKKAILMTITNLPTIGGDVNKGFMIFMSIQFTDDVEITPMIESEYTIAQEKIKNIYHAFYKKRIEKSK